MPVSTGICPLSKLLSLLIYGMSVCHLSGKEPAGLPPLVPGWGRSPRLCLAPSQRAPGVPVCWVSKQRATSFPHCSHAAKWRICVPFEFTLQVGMLAPYRVRTLCSCHLSRQIIAASLLKHGVLVQIPVFTDQKGIAGLGRQGGLPSRGKFLSFIDLSAGLSSLSN